MGRPVLEAETVWELVRRRAEVSQDVPMLLDAGGRRVTFSEFAVQAERVAAGLQALGVGPGTTVAWQLPTRIDTVLLSMALARLGAVQNPILHIYREREVGAVLTRSTPELFLVPGTWRGFDFAAMAGAICDQLPRPPKVMLVDELPVGDPAGLPAPPATGGDVRWVYYTSGTTSE